MAYIKIEKAISEIDKGDLLVGNNAEWAKEILYRIPTADVVEVVRCKNCKKFCEYSDSYKSEVEGADGDCFIRVLNSDNEQFIGVKYDDFCSRGERKTT